MMAEPPKKRRRTQLTFEQKNAILKFKNENTNYTQSEICDHFSNEWKTTIGRSTISDIIKQKDQIQNSPKSKRSRHRSGAKENLETALLMWFNDKRSQGAFISDSMLMEKAKFFGCELKVETDFKYSYGWIQRFKLRHGIQRYVAHGEAGSADMALVETGREKLMDLLELKDRDDIFNLDETGLFYRLGPNSTLASGPVQGKKRSKERISVALCCNATGTYKCKPLVIGKAERPRCFGKTYNPSLYVTYRNNKKAWMTMTVFHEWLKSFDREMRLLGKHVTLLVDNATSHSVEGCLLTNVTVEYLPPNTTSHIQPMDAGIIRNFKFHYKSLLCKQYVTCVEQGCAQTIDLKLAIAFIKQAWDNVTGSTIVNCWNHVQIISDAMNIPLSTLRPVEDDMPLAELRQLIGNLPHDGTVDSMSVGDYVEIDSCLETGESLNDNSILDIAKGECGNDECGSDGDDEGNDESLETQTLEVVSKESACKSIQTVITFLEQNNQSDHLCKAWDLFHQINKCKSNVTQKTITDFFKSN